MSEISLHTAEDNSGVYVSNTFIDTYMKPANGEYVKIYLYLLRSLSSAGSGFSISSMADALEHTTKDITRALVYWERQNLLRLEYNVSGELTGICLLDPDKPRYSVREDMPVVTDMPIIMPQTTPISQPAPISQPVPVQTAVMPQMPSKVVRMPQRQTFAQGPDHSYSPDEITLLGKDDAVPEMLFVTESYLGHPLSPNETNILLYWYDGMDMSSDLIEYLVEYCIERGHKDIRYMNSVAINWVKEGILSKEDAIEHNKTHTMLYRTVRKSFGIMGRNLTSAEEKYIDTWQQVYGFDIDLIKEACDRTIIKAHNPSFAYADTILKTWREAGVKQLSDVMAEDEAFSRKNTAKRKLNVVKTDNFHYKDEQDYDYDAIERRLLMQE